MSYDDFVFDSLEYETPTSFFPPKYTQYNPTSVALVGLLCEPLDYCAPIISISLPEYTCPSYLSQSRSPTRASKLSTSAIGTWYVLHGITVVLEKRTMLKESRTHVKN